MLVACRLPAQDYTAQSALPAPCRGRTSLTEPGPAPDAQLPPCLHAGNHADVLKHLILTQIAEYMGEKPVPFWIIDTHAGAGRYALESPHATKLGEYKDGIGRLWDAKGLPPAVTDYVDLVRQLNPDGQLKHYPGSPWLARQLLREGDRLRVSRCTAPTSACCRNASKAPAGPSPSPRATASPV